MNKYYIPQFTIYLFVFLFIMLIITIIVDNL